MCRLLRGLVVAGLLLGTVLAAADPDPTDMNNNTDQLQCQTAAENDRYEKMIDRLVNERQQLNEASNQQFELVKTIFENDRQSINGLIEKAFWLFGALFSVAGVLFYYFFGQSRNELHDLFEKHRSDAVDLVEKEKETLLSEFERLKQLTDQDLKEIKHYFQEKNRIRKVQWVYGATDASDLDTIRSVKAKWPVEIHESVLTSNWQPDKTECDVVVFSMKSQDDLQPSFAEFIATLKRLGEPALIVFTFNPSARINLADKQLALLNQYSNYMIANIPGTLQATLGNAVNNV